MRFIKVRFFSMPNFQSTKSMSVCGETMCGCGYSNSDPIRYKKGGGISPSDLEEGKRFLPTKEKSGGKNSCFSAKEKGDDGRGSISHLYRGRAR